MLEPLHTVIHTPNTRVPWIGCDHHAHGLDNARASLRRGPRAVRLTIIANPERIRNPTVRLLQVLLTVQLKSRFRMPAVGPGRLGRPG